MTMLEIVIYFLNFVNQEKKKIFNFLLCSGFFIEIKYFLENCSFCERELQFNMNLTFFRRSKHDFFYNIYKSLEHVRRISFSI